MQCSEFLENLSLYLDDALAPQFRNVSEDHLRTCPVCRAELAEMRELQNGLSLLGKASVPFDLATAISRSVTIELAAQQVITKAQVKVSSWQFVWDEYLQPQLIPYTTGVLASLLLFTMMFVSLVNSISAFREMDAQSRRERREREVLLAAAVTTKPYEELTSFPAADYAVRRLRISAESPSLNPQSAFVALTSSLTRSETKNDAIMVVADVLSDGVAKIADVIQPPREASTLVELDKLLREDPAFVTAALDRRPENVRVVLLIQKVDVRESDQPAQIKNQKLRKF